MAIYTQQYILENSIYDFDNIINNITNFNETVIVTTASISFDDIKTLIQHTILGIRKLINKAILQIQNKIENSRIDKIIKLKDNLPNSISEIDKDKLDKINEYLEKHPFYVHNNDIHNYLYGNECVGKSKSEIRDIIVTKDPKFTEIRLSDIKNIDPGFKGVIKRLRDIEKESTQEAKTQIRNYHKSHNDTTVSASELYTRIMNICSIAIEEQLIFLKNSLYICKVLSE